MGIVQKINNSLKQRETFQPSLFFLSLFLGIQLRHYLPVLFPEQFMYNQFYLVTALITFLFYVVFKVIQKVPYSELIEVVFISLGIAFGIDYFIGIFNSEFMQSKLFAVLPYRLAPVIYVLYLYNYKNASHFIRPIILAFLFASNLSYFVLNSLPMEIKLYNPWNAYAVVLFYITYITLMNRSAFLAYIDKSKAKISSFYGAIGAFLVYTLYFALSLKQLTFVQSFLYFSEWDGDRWFGFFSFVVVTVFILSFARFIPITTKPKQTQAAYNTAYTQLFNTNKSNKNTAPHSINNKPKIEHPTNTNGTKDERKEEPNKHITNAPEQSKPHQTTVKPNDVSTKPIQRNPLEELDSLIGLNSVKEDVNQLIKEIRTSRLREEVGLKVNSKSRHLVFTGNPGTGKTTVARLIAKVYAEIGVLSKGHIVEIDRAGLVGRYIGETEEKTEAIIQKALGGVLFIDEAYSLANNGENDFGKQAIDVLLKRMEDSRENLIVIVAGYTDNMQEFISSNPGLESRFPKYINFPDYTPNDMVEIFELMCKNGDYIPTIDSLSKVQVLFEEKYQARDKKFGNGRFVRNVYEKITSNQASRISSLDKPTKIQLQTIEFEDIS